MGKKIVTSALPYANGEIHLGHIASTYLPADILVRFLRLRGDEVAFVCATDDFGTPILIEAEIEGKSPKQFVNHWHERDEKDFKDFGISFDIFDQTSSKENIDLTQHFFNELYAKDYIFKQEIWQLYCIKCGKFLPDRYVRGTCPYCHSTDQYSDSCEKCGRTLHAGEIKDPHCAICGSKPMNKRSNHYFLKLSKFSNELETWLLENENLQSEVKNYVLGWIKEGLKDWDISRDISWGVPIPLKEAEGKVLYGWFDNHLCYISATLKYFSMKAMDGKDFWNSATIYHFIGKDIVYHHFLFLPAMRFGVRDFKLPDYIPTRGHLMLHNQKFSKSRGWYISLRDFLSLFPSDYLRYYLSIITSYDQSDVNFDLGDFRTRINNELIAKIGNFIHRTLSFIWSNYDGKVPKPKQFNELDEKFRDEIWTIADEVGTEIKGIELNKGLRKILDFAVSCNQYFQHKKPWDNKEDSGTCLFLCVNAVGSLAILLGPYMPFSAEEVWNQINLKSFREQKWSSASKLTVKSGHKINEPRILFKRVQVEEVEMVKKKLLRSNTV